MVRKITSMVIRSQISSIFQKGHIYFFSFTAYLK